MIDPPYPSDEKARLTSLRALKVLDTAPEERYDRITRLAKRLFGVPIALVSLVDSKRQWFKSCQGLAASETPREVSFCGHAILGDDILVVNDAQSDERFHDNPLVCDQPGIRFYAGYPLHSPSAHRVGTLCIVDREPRTITDEEVSLLRDLGQMVEQELASLDLATVDELTGLSNRRGFLAVADQAFAYCVRLQTAISLVFIDLDEFKPINDEFGHAAGDQALVEFAQCMLAVFRDSDVIARLGGDEFCVLLTGGPGHSAALPLERLKNEIHLRNAARQAPYALDFSAGTVAYDPARHSSLNDLMREADRIMYDRKRDKHQNSDRPPTTSGKRRRSASV
jgi:diguanylate cyclase (GGDEF)-like protein